MEVHWERRLRALAAEAPSPAPSPIVSYWADDFRHQSAYNLCADIIAPAQQVLLPGFRTIAGSEMILPLSRTIILCAILIVDNLCATTITVFPESQ